MLRDHARRQTHEEQVLRHVSAGDSPEYFDARLDAVEHRDELYRALATLNEDERECLALRFGADLKLRDVRRRAGRGRERGRGPDLPGAGQACARTFSSS